MRADTAFTMNLCTNCGSNDWVALAGPAGCGGMGRLKGCNKCRKVYMQVTGGIIAPAGGQKWTEMSYTIEEYLESQKSKPSGSA